MHINGQNLVLVLWALNDALAEVHNEIATCPDVFDPDNRKRLDELEKQMGTYETLKNKVQAACVKAGLITLEDD